MGFLLNIIEVHGAALSLVFIGRAFVDEVLVRAANHAEIVLLMTFSHFWKELTVGAEDFGKVGFLGLGRWADDEEAEGVVALELNLDSVVCDLEEWEEVAVALPLEGFELEVPLVDVYNQSSSLHSQ